MLLEPLPSIPRENSLRGVVKRVAGQNVRYAGRVVDHVRTAVKDFGHRAWQWLLDISNDWLLERCEIAVLFCP